MKATLINWPHVPGDEIAGMAAALCADSKNAARSLDHALESGHQSVAEHASYTFMIEGVSRVLLAQLTRHRIASYSVQSQRYCGADMEVVIPPSLWDGELVDDIIDLKRAVEKLYRKAVSMGKPEEDTRYLTLQGGVTKIMVTMNARELWRFFELRCCNRAQWEIREMAWAMLKECRRMAPRIFHDAGPGCVRGRCPEKRSCGKPYVLEERHGE